MIATATGGGCTLAFRVHPGAKRNAITGIHDGALNVSLTAPPTDGRAKPGSPASQPARWDENAALLAFLAERLGIPRRSIEIIAGTTSRSKTLRLTGITAAEAETRLLKNFA